MLQLLKIEWLKIKNYRTFWILLVLIIVSIPAFNYMWYDITDNSFPTKEMGRMLLGKPYAFSLVWQTVSWYSTLLLFLPALLIITLNTNEFVFKTHRQNVIDGWAREQFISVKFLQVLLMSLFMTLVVAGTTVWLGRLGTPPEDKTNMFANIRQLLYFFLTAVSYLMFALMLSILIKRSGLALGVFFLYSMIIEQIIVLVADKYARDAGRFLPIESCDRLILNPLRQKVMKPATIAQWQQEHNLFLTITLLYIALFAFVAWYVFTKKDL
jgi:ABC-2 type transport system permease protein